MCGRTFLLKGFNWFREFVQIFVVYQFSFFFQFWSVADLFFAEFDMFGMLVLFSFFRIVRFC
jgi:hypothetical protein